MDSSMGILLLVAGVLLLVAFCLRQHDIRKATKVRNCFNCAERDYCVGHLEFRADACKDWNNVDSKF